MGFEVHRTEQDIERIQMTLPFFNSIFNFFQDKLRLSPGYSDGV